MTFQELLQIKAEEQKVLQDMQANLAQRKTERAAVFKRANDSENKFDSWHTYMQRKNNASPDELTRYNNLDKACTILNVEIEKQEIIIAFIDEYMKNARGALAYNYYLNELSRRPKLHNKPLHYKVVINALQEIYGNMPDEIKTGFYNLDFICNGRYYSYKDIAKDNTINVDVLAWPLQLEFNNPAAIARNNYNVYCQIFQVLEKAYKDVTQLENAITTPFNDSYSMQYARAGRVSHLIKQDVTKSLPPSLWRVFGK